MLLRGGLGLRMLLIGRGWAEGFQPDPVLTG